MSTAQATAHLTPATVRHLVDGGRWRRVHPGVLVTHTGPIDDRQRVWIASLAVGNGQPAVLGGRTALELLGLKGFAADQVHVLIVAARRVFAPPPGVIVHRTRVPSPADLHGASFPPCTTVARSLVDAAGWARSADEARTLIAMAFQQRMTTLAEVDRVLRRMPRAKRRQLVVTTSTDAAGGAHSLGELDVRALLRKSGLPMPTSQHVRRDATGRRRYLDLYWEQWRLHVEIDGAHHLDPAASVVGRGPPKPAVG